MTKNKLFRTGIIGFALSLVFDFIYIAAHLELMLYFALLSTLVGLIALVLLFTDRTLEPNQRGRRAKR